MKSFRLQSHLTQQQLADKLGVRRNTVGSWERGDFLPASKAQVLELARHMRLNDQEMRHLLEASLTALTPHWLVPLPRNPYFTGREEVLKALHTQLGVGHRVALTQSLVLHGLGGIGKTQVALEYAYRHALEYSAVFWIGAETEESIVSSLSRVASVLRLPEEGDKDQQRVLAAVQRWLSTHGQWFLIWDNVEELGMLDRFLPSVRSGAILITTRCRVLGTLAQGLDLLPLEQEEGILFLFRRAKVLSPEATCEDVRRVAESRPTESVAASELVMDLGGLPLALDQAGAYIEETQCALSTYLELFRSRRAVLLQQRGNGSSTHPTSVSTTFTLAFSTTARRHPAVMDLLHACALLQTDAIPEELFRQGAEHLGPKLEAVCRDPLEWDRLVGVACSYSLLSRQPEEHTLSMHRLVQAVLRESLEAPAAQQWSVRILQAMNAAFPEPACTDWALCEHYGPLAQVSLQLIKQAGRSIPEARELFLKMGNYLVERGCYTEAEQFFVQICAPGELQDKENDPGTASMLNLLATIYWRQGKYQQAEPLFQRALTISEHCLGPNYFDTANYLNNLALLYLEQGNYRQAEMLEQRSLTIAEYQLDPMHPDLALNCDNMGCILAAQGKYTQAEQVFQRALAIWEGQPEPPPPSMIYSLNNLGVCYLEQRNYELAEPLLQRALALRLQSLGPEHPATANSLHNLARLFLGQGKLEEAAQMSQRALLILEQRGGSDRLALSLSRILEKLGVISQEQSKYEQAESLLVQALTLQEQHLGQCHPGTGQTVHDLSLLQQKQGNLSEAVSLAERALHIRLQSLGEAHPKTIVTQALYAQLLQELSYMQETTPSEHNLEKTSDAPEAERPFHKPLSCEYNPLQRFLDACCELHPSAWCRSADLWQAYQLWAKEHQERYPLSRMAFTQQLKVAGGLFSQELREQMQAAMTDVGWQQVDSTRKGRAIYQYRPSPRLPSAKSGPAAQHDQPDLAITGVGAEVAGDDQVSEMEPDAPVITISDLSEPPITMARKLGHLDPLSYHAKAEQNDVKALITIRPHRDYHFPGGYILDERMSRVDEFALGRMGKKQEAHARALLDQLREQVQTALIVAGWERRWTTVHGKDLWLYVGTTGQPAGAASESTLDIAGVGAEVPGQDQVSEEDITLASQDQDDQLEPETRQSHIIEVVGNSGAKGRGQQAAYSREVFTKPVTFTCIVCSETVTQQRYPGHTPLYCSEGCREIRQRERTRERVAKHREEKKKQAASNNSPQEHVTL